MPPPDKRLQLTRSVRVCGGLGRPPAGPRQDRGRRPVAAKVVHARPQLSRDPLGGGKHAEMILILNGASSSGKTALARALQEHWGRPLLHLGTDTMIAMLPAAYVGMKPSASDGIEFVNDTDARGPLVRARRGEVGRKLEDSFASAARSLANGGHDLVLDLVLYDPSSLQSYVRAFQDLHIYFVGVRCDLSVLEARELARGDRFANLARSQHLIVHTFSEFYDLEVDTTASGPHQLAEAIVEFVRANPTPQSFLRLAAKIGGDAPAA